MPGEECRDDVAPSTTRASYWSMERTVALKSLRSHSELSSSSTSDVERKYSGPFANLRGPWVVSGQAAVGSTHSSRLPKHRSRKGTKYSFGLIAALSGARE